jgi:hypothetical protein
MKQSGLTVNARVLRPMNVDDGVREPLTLQPRSRHAIARRARNGYQHKPVAITTREQIGNLPGAKSGT